MGWIIVSAIALVLIALIVLQFPQTQQFLTGKAEKYLRSQLQTNISIGGIYFDLPGKFTVENLYLEDQQRDTLVYSRNLSLNINIPALLRKEVHIGNIELAGFYGKIERLPPDTTFNFNFIIDAFTPADTIDEEKLVENARDTTATGWLISVGGLELEQVRFLFNDELAGNRFYADVGTLEVYLDEMDLDQNAYFIDKISLGNSSGSFRITKLMPDTTATDEESVPLELSIGEVEIYGLDFDYGNEVAGQQLSVSIGEFHSDSRSFSFDRQEIDLKELRFENSTLSYVQDPVAASGITTIGEPEVEQASKPWRISAESISLNGNKVQYDDNNFQRQEQGMDFNHLLIEDLAFLAQDFKFEASDIIAGISQFSFREKSGFALNNFSTRVELTDRRATLEELNVNTLYSSISADIWAEYPSLDSIADRLGDVILNMDVHEASIGFRDMLYLSPDLSQTAPFKGNEAASIFVVANIAGPVDNLSINRFRVNAFSGTSLATNGRIRGLPDVSKAWYDFERVRLTTVASDLKRIAIPDSVARKYGLPSRMNLIAGFQGSMSDFQATARLFTTVGELSANIEMDPGERYTAQLSVDSLQLGEIMKNDTVYGPLTLRAEVSGQGFSPDSLKANLDLLVEQAVFNRYTYSGLTLTGQIEESVFNGHIAYQDSSLHFDFDGIVSLNVDTPRYDLAFNLHGADLRKLNLSSENLAVQGTLLVDLSGNSLNNINGDAGIRDVLIVKEGQPYRVDSLLFASIVDRRQTNIRIDSDLLSAHFDGTINLGDLPATLKRHFNRYYDLKGVTETDTLERQNFEFEIQLHNPELLTEVIATGLERFVPGAITGSYDSRDNNLTLDILIPELLYNNIRIDTFTFHVDSDDYFLNFGTSIGNFGLGPVEMENLAVVGQVYDNLIETRLQVTDHESREMYAIGGIFSSMEGVYRFAIEPEVLLNYQIWKADSSNYIEMSERPVFIRDLRLSKEDQLLSVETQIGGDADSTMFIAFENFNIETLSRLAQGDTTLLEGALDGELSLRQDSESLVFTSDLTINDLALFESRLGNLALQAGSGPNGRINMNAALSGNQNNVNATGYYQPGEEGGMNMALDFAPLNLASFSGPLHGMISELEGFINGGLEIAGTTGSPRISGSLAFNEVSLFVEDLQTSFTVDDQRIRFDDRGIGFDRFRIVDISENDAEINGYILTSNYSDFSFDLSVDADYFELLNTAAEDNQMYYGHVVVDAEARITGSMIQPDIQMDLVVKEETNLTYALPDEAPASVQVEGLVEFISREPRTVIERAQAEVEETAYASELTGMDLTANVRVERGATLQIIVDPNAGDNLVTRANPSSLSLNIDQVGNISLTGSFEIAEGSYQFSFSFIKRRFDIRQGSQITWLGNPMDADINITAINTVETTPAGILPEGSIDNRGLSQRLPVQVLLNMKGNLMNPDISFELTVSEEAETGMAAAVRQRLQTMDEADRNKQVFALLVLQRFISDNPLETQGGGGGLSATARNSVSKILNSQLNSLSQRIKGFDLSFDLESYQTAEGEAQTQLDVTLSRSFFNDRVNVKIGGAIDLEGQNQARQSQTRRGLDEYIGDIAVEYKLTPSGNLLLEFFREQTYETFYNELIETGIGIIYIRNYNRFSELLKPNEPEQEIRNEARK